MSRWLQWYYYLLGKLTIQRFESIILFDALCVENCVSQIILFHWSNLSTTLTIKNKRVIETQTFISDKLLRLLRDSPGPHIFNPKTLSLEFTRWRWHHILYSYLHNTHTDSHNNHLSIPVIISIINNNKETPGQA